MIGFIIGCGLVGALTFPLIICALIGNKKQFRICVVAFCLSVMVSILSLPFYIEAIL